jgi:predicted Zn-dependent protease
MPRKAGSPAKATQYLQRAVQVDSNNPADYLRLSVLLGAINRMAESVRVLQQGLLLSPYNRLFYEFLAARYISMQQQEDATKVAHQGLQLFPEDATLRDMLEKANSTRTSP